MAVSLRVGDKVEADLPSHYFQPIYPALSGMWPYEPSSDGQRFLVLIETETASPPVTIVVNWQAGIKR